MKVVGRRRWRGGLVAAAGLLEIALRLRGDKPFIPKVPCSIDPLR